MPVSIFTSTFQIFQRAKNGVPTYPDVLERTQRKQLLLHRGQTTFQQSKPQAPGNRLRSIGNFVWP
jgi:hypothetical protein